jgi:hypothetical protein
MNNGEASFSKQWLGCTNMNNAQGLMLALLLNPFTKLLAYH